MKFMKDKWEKVRFEEIAKISNLSCNSVRRENKYQLLD